MKKKKWIVFLCIAALLCSAVAVAVVADRANRVDIPTLLRLPSNDEWQMETDSYYYGNYYKEHNDGGAVDYIDAEMVPAVASDENVKQEQGANKTTVSVLRPDQTAKFVVEVPKNAYYNIAVTYQCEADSALTPEGQLLIDEELPFDEAYFITFDRHYIEQRSNKKDYRGDEIRGEQIEQFGFYEKILSDYQGLYRAPFRFYLTEGTHTLSFVGKECTVYIADVSLSAPEQPVSYAEYIRNYQDMTKIQDQKKIECEFPALKTSSSVRSEWTSDPLTSPRAVTNITYNVFGGDSWQDGGQKVTFNIHAEKTGLYSLAFRYVVSKSGAVSYRRILVDGQVPFKEFEEYPFTENKWSLGELVDENGDTIYLYLEAGDHTLSLETTAGPLRQAMKELELCQAQINELYRKIGMVTATVKDSNGNAIIDKNRDYELDKKIPTLQADMDSIVALLERVQSNLLIVSQGRKQEVSGTIEFALETFAKMQKDPEQIPYEYNQLSDLVVSLSDGAAAMKRGPLLLDYILLGDSTEELPRVTSNIFDNTYAVCQSFIHSFVETYSGIKSDEQITVWVSRGRDWVLLLDQLTAEKFTKETGIAVNFNIMPMSSDYRIIIARSGGRSPDVTLGVGGTTPVEFAARDAVVELSQFSGFDELLSELVPNAVKGYTYENGVYAIPETADFMLTFYRTDIFEDLGLEPPSTFEDVYKIMPILQENNMQFYYPAGVGGYTPFLMQYGEDYYTDDLRKTTLSNVQSIRAFQEFTDLFNKYKLPLQADFFQRMRMGEMPVGVGGYDMYVRLMTSAPELSGKWDIAPLVGREVDGEIVRTAPVGQSAAIILKTDKDPELSWKFLNWWMSSETQEAYGAELRNLLGIGSVWNSANMKAFAKIGLKQDHVNVILEQWEYAEQLPIVPGSYFVDRCLLTAWTRNVLQGESARIVLENAAMDIDKELERKYKEFH